MITTITKHKRIRLHGKAVKELNGRIHERDGHCCVLCGKPVDDGEKWHHVYFGNGNKNDVEEEGVTLCMDCHKIAHGPDARDIRVALLQYLEAVNNEN